MLGATLAALALAALFAERRRHLGSIIERNLQLALAGRAARVGSFAYDIDKEEIQISEGYAAIHGLPEGTTHLTRRSWQMAVHHEDRHRVEDLRSRVFFDRGREYGTEYRIVCPDAEVRWIEARCFVSYRSDGRPQRVVGVNIDVTGRKRAEDHQSTLAAELDHRVKNALAAVSAVAARTLDTSGSMQQFVTALDGRIRSMATTHELLSGRQWQGIPLVELLRHQLAPYATSNTLNVDGPDVVLGADASQTVGMVLHELITNAAKYGALSTRDGRISVRWQWSQNGKVPDRLVVEWRELGGPVVQAPGRSGHGTDVIRDLIAYELDGNVDLAFASEGFRYRFDIPVSQLTSRDRLGDNGDASAPVRTTQDSRAKATVAVR
jgi:PAS domain S-box-containing protein